MSMINYISYAYCANYSHRTLIYLLSSDIIHDELTGALPPQDPSVGDAVHSVLVRADVCP